MEKIKIIFNCTCGKEKEIEMELDNFSSDDNYKIFRFMGDLQCECGKYYGTTSEIYQFPDYDSYRKFLDPLGLEIKQKK